MKNGQLGNKYVALGMISKRMHSIVYTYDSDELVTIDTYRSQCFNFNSSIYVPISA